MMSSPLMIGTQRTLLRPFTLADAAEAYGWFSDAEVMRHIPNGPDTSLQQTEARLQRYIKHQQENGFSKWVIIHRETGRLIGDGGFFRMPDGVRVELGYRLARDFWGKGFATEVSQAWIKQAREFTGQSVIYAFANPENAASLHVIQKLGFQFSHHEEVYGWDAPVYKMATGCAE